jgi:hypothetical protein
MKIIWKFIHKPNMFYVNQLVPAYRTYKCAKKSRTNLAGESPVMKGGVRSIM